MMWMVISISHEMYASQLVDCEKAAYQYSPVCYVVSEKL